MNPELFKTGACSILLGDKHYSGFFSPQNNKLFKVTKLTKNHNEFVNMAKIRSITKYDKYFIIPDEELFEIKHGENFYEFLEKLTKHKGDNLLSKKPCLYGNYIDYGGEKDLHDSIIEMTGSLITFWDFMRNLFFVIIGNIIGGGVFVGLVYHIIYQRKN